MQEWGGHLFITSSVNRLKCSPLCSRHFEFCISSGSVCGLLFSNFALNKTLSDFVSSCRASSTSRRVLLSDRIRNLLMTPNNPLWFSDSLSFSQRMSAKDNGWYKGAVIKTFASLQDGFGLVAWADWSYGACTGCLFLNWQCSMLAVIVSSPWERITGYR